MPGHTDLIESAFENPNWKQVRKKWKLIVGGLLVLLVLMGA